MRGIETNLVKSAKIKKSEQRTSARTAKTRDVLLPIPKKLIGNEIGKVGPFLAWRKDHYCVQQKPQPAL